MVHMQSPFMPMMCLQFLFTRKCWIIAAQHQPWKMILWALRNEHTFNENVVKDQSTVLMAFQNLVDVQLTKIGSFGENEIKEELSELLNRSSKLILAILKTSHHDWKTVQKLHRECQSIIEDSVTCRASLSQQPSSHLWMSVRDQYYKPNLTIIQLP